jgi:hypothetical protein
VVELSPEMRAFVERVRLGFYATVNADGTPNVSPKGTTYVLGPARLAFADVRSPGTVENVRRGSPVEVCLVDPLTRKGWRFRGTGAVCGPGSPELDALLGLMRAGGSSLAGRVRAAVVVEVAAARRVSSPIYDGGAVREDEVVARYRARFGAGPGRGPELTDGASAALTAARPTP